MAFTSESARIAGKKGGLKTKERLKDDPDYYRRTGYDGGMAMKKKYGHKYAEWGPKSWEVRRQRQEQT